METVEDLCDHIALINKSKKILEGSKKEVKVVKIKDIPFKDDFKIKTDRYQLIRDTDWFPSRLVWHTVSCISKLLFWDEQIWWWLDEKRTKAVLSMLEQNKDIQNLTVRVNHNEWFYDWYRMMFHKDLREENPFLYRLIKWSWDTAIDEIWAEFWRGDYYNALTRTVVLYSNIESIAAHELGHHVDFDKFPKEMKMNDPLARWIYDGSRYFPPVMLYQEWQASKNAKALMSKEDEYQFRRYLIPAFYTYLLSVIFIIFSYFSQKRSSE